MLKTTNAHQKTIRANIRNKIDSGEMGENPIKRMSERHTERERERGKIH